MLVVRLWSNITFKKICRNKFLRKIISCDSILGMNPMPQHTQSMVTPGGMVNVGMANAAAAAAAARGMMVNQQQMPMQQQLTAPPGYNMANANRPRWPMMPPQQVQRQPYNIAQKQGNAQQSSALIAQLTQPPSSVAAGGGVNQFGQSEFLLLYFLFQSCIISFKYFTERFYARLKIVLTYSYTNLK